MEIILQFSEQVESTVILKAMKLLLLCMKQLWVEMMVNGLLWSWQQHQQCGWAGQATCRL